MLLLVQALTSHQTVRHNSISLIYTQTVRHNSISLIYTQTVRHNSISLIYTQNHCSVNNKFLINISK